MSVALGIRGYLLDTPEFGKLRAVSNGALIIEDGRITEIGDYEFLKRKPRPVRWLHSARVAVLPGLIDLHAHLPQYAMVGRSNRELLAWMREKVFPAEREFTGPRARREAALFFEEAARHGTTTAMVCAGIYEDSCNAAFEAAEKLGMRVIMGQLMMDQETYPGQPSKVLSISVHESERLCKKWHGAAEKLLEYAFSPRSAAGCSEKLLRRAAELANEYGAYLQTQLAENSVEVEKVRHLFGGASHAEVYERTSVLGRRTVLSQAVHISEEEIAIAARAGAAVAHSPGANLFLSAGIMPLDRLLEAGIRMGLGSDVGAGPELNLWGVMRSAIEAQKARGFYQPEVKALGPVEALYLATQGAAGALGKGDVIGSFEIGKEADLCVMDIGALLPYRRDTKAEADLSAEDILSLCVYRGGPHAVVEAFVRGRSIYRAPEPELF